jgi:hypothetical protein
MSENLPIPEPVNRSLNSERMAGHAWKHRPDLKGAHDVIQLDIHGFLPGKIGAAKQYLALRQSLDKVSR